jgi:hypothetical protein
MATYADSPRDRLRAALDAVGDRATYVRVEVIDLRAFMGTSQCGCLCGCHEEEDRSDWPGPCAACCEPGDRCDCGRELARLGLRP